MPYPFNTISRLRRHSLMIQASEQSSADAARQESPVKAFFCHPLAHAAMTLLGASCVLTVATGDIGFQGDDWWVLSFPYWNAFPHSVAAYARAASRPIEGVFWISLFEIFGMDRIPYLFASLALNGLSSSLFALCLFRLDPENPKLAIWGALFSFFLPLNSPLVFVMHTDNSRLAMAFFWAAVLTAQTQSYGSPWRIALASACYLLSVLTYENASLLIFALPFFARPRHAGNAVQTRRIWTETALIIVIGFLGFLALRFLLLSGGAVNHASVVPSMALLLSYCSGLFPYLLAPFKDVTRDVVSLVFGASVGCAAFALVKGASFPKQPQKALTNDHARSLMPVSAAGFAVFLLGITPYLLAGYSASFGFTGQSRVYSSGSYGVAMILAALFSINWSSRILRRVVNLVAALLLTLMAAFQCDLRRDWQIAAEIRRDLCESLLTVAGKVSDHTTLLFLDLQSYLGNRAVIFQGVDGLDQYVKMLYNNKTLHAFFLYSRDADGPSSSERTAIITPEGVSARGSAPYGPAPLDSILIFRCHGRELSLVESLSSDDAFVNARWVGVAAIASQTSRIISGDCEHAQVRRCLY